MSLYKQRIEANDRFNSLHGMIAALDKLGLMNYNAKRIIAQCNDAWLAYYIELALSKKKPT